jgi:hypothetical protein
MRFPSIPLSMVGMLALTGCDGTPVAPRTDTVEVPLNALLEESGSSATMARTSCAKRVKNNLKQIGLAAAHNFQQLVLIVHGPSVDVDRGDDDRAAGTVAGFLVAHQDGEGCGELQVTFGDGSVRFISSSINSIWDGESLVLMLAGEAEFCPAGEGPCELAGFTGEVHLDTRAQGQAIFQLSKDGGTLDGPFEHRFAAPTYLVLPGQGEDERRTLADGPAALWMDGEKTGHAMIELTGRVGTAAVHGSIYSIADGTSKTYAVLLGLLLRDGDGYRWVLLTEEAGERRRAITPLFGSELLLRSGPTLQDDDTWILGGVVYVRDQGDWICL